MNVAAVPLSLALGITGLASLCRCAGLLEIRESTLEIIDYRTVRVQGLEVMYRLHSNYTKERVSYSRGALLVHSTVRKKLFHPYPYWSTSQ